MVTELSDEELLAGSEWPEGDADGCELILTDGKKKLRENTAQFAGEFYFSFFFSKRRRAVAESFGPLGRVLSSWSCPVILVPFSYKFHA
jgi:hypothetical protein